MNKIYTWKEYWHHVRLYIRLLLDFPVPWRDNHFWTGLVDGDEYLCMTCNRESTRDYVDSLD